MERAAADWAETSQAFQAFQAFQASQASQASQAEAWALRSVPEWKLRVKLLVWVQTECAEGLTTDGATDGATDATKSAAAGVDGAAAEGEEHNAQLALSAVSECFTGAHGSLELRAMGAQFAAFLASRLPERLLLATFTRGPTNETSAALLARLALDVLQGAAAYSTKDGGSTGANSTGAGGGGGAGVVSASNNGEGGGGGGGGGGGVGGFVDLRDRGAVRAGDLLSRVCAVVASVARRAPWTVATTTLAPRLLFGLLARDGTANHLRMDITEALSALAPAFASQLGPHLRHLAGAVGQTNGKVGGQAEGETAVGTPSVPSVSSEPAANSAELATTAAEIRVLLWRAATLRDFR